MPEPTNGRRVPVTVTVDAADLREWASRHADSGHHGVAHVLYQAAEGVESITEQHDREVAAQARREAAEALARWRDEDAHGIFNPPGPWSRGTRYGIEVALAWLREAAGTCPACAADQSQYGLDLAAAVREARRTGEIR